MAKPKQEALAPEEKQQILILYTAKNLDEFDIALTMVHMNHLAYPIKDIKLFIQSLIKKKKLERNKNTRHHKIYSSAILKRYYQGYSIPRIVELAVQDIKNEQQLFDQQSAVVPMDGVSLPIYRDPEMFPDYKITAEKVKTLIANLIYNDPSAERKPNYGKPDQHNITTPRAEDDIILRLLNEPTTEKKNFGGFAKIINEELDIHTKPLKDTGIYCRIYRLEGLGLTPKDKDNG